jgi:hypothetical protein
VTPPASHRRPWPKASSHFPSLSGAAGDATVISGALLALLAAGLAFGLIRRRATLRRIPMHVRAPGGPAVDRTGSSAAMGPKMPSGGPGWERPRVPGPVWQSPVGRSGQGIPQLPADQGTAPADLSWAGEPVRLANRILSDADHQAAEIRQQAACQVGDMREAAERDAAELRATLMEMSAELGRVAAYVTEILQSSAMSRPGFVGGYDALASGMIIV